MKGFLQLCRSQLLSGISLGLALMVSALFAVYSFEDSTISVRWMNLLPCMTVLYMLAGVLLMAWHRRPPRRRPATPYLSGLNARYIWVLPAFLWWLLFRLTGFDVLERCLLFNLILLAVLWTIEYSMARRMAKALNGALGTRSPTVMPTSLIVDLDDCPKGTEAFCIEIERYCIKNHIDYQFIERDKPAIILMNGVKHRVELGVYYGYVLGWFLKFTEL